MSNDRQAALAALLKLRSQVEQGTQDHCGICANTATMGIDDVLLAQLFKRWPEYSGNSSYPVPYAGEPAGRGYWDRPTGCGADALDYMWGDNNYGRARRRLLDFCIAELQRELGLSCSVPDERAVLEQPVKATSKTHKPAHGGYPTPSMPEPDRGYIGTDASYDAIKTTTPTTCCPCGQVPVCHGLRSCGKSSA